MSRLLALKARLQIRPGKNGTIFGKWNRIMLRFAMQMREAHCLKWHIWGLLLAPWLTPGVCWAEDDAASIRAAIARASKIREDRVVTLNCEWSAATTWGAKCWVYHDKAGAKFYLPTDDLTVSSEYRFRLKEHAKMRLECTGPRPNQETRSFETREYVSVTDGEVQKCFYGKDRGSDEPRFAPTGFIYKEKTLPETSTIHLWPLLMLYRPSVPEIAAELDLTKFAYKGPITIDGRECVLFERSGGVMGKNELAIDMNRDCVPVRIRNLVHDESLTDAKWYPSRLIEIEYVDQADKSWRLAGWKTAIMGERGKVREQMRAVVKELAVNVDLPDAVFRFDFPVGTKVANWETNEHYIIREGGEKRTVTDAESEARVPYKRLLTTDSGQGLEPEVSRVRLWLFVFLVIMVCAFLLLRIVYVRRRTTRQNATGG